MTFDAAPVLPGETLAGKYRVERILGRGGMGIVVAARHLELEERVAIKFLLRKDDESAIARFQREARAAAKVKSEHVCRVFDVGRLETGEPYLVMEYLDGVDLADRLRAQGRLAVKDVAAWIIEACAALAEAHAIGIVHRDLKPANIFLAKRADESSTVKILDFGISKLPSVDAMTSTTAVMGTPIYMSPEQVASAKDVDHRTDVWSLGVIMYELVSGGPPFVADSIIQLSVKIREQDLPPLESGDSAFDAVVMKCLAKDRDARWSSVGELARALAPIAGPSSVDLAARAARTATSVKAALAETVRDERDDESRIRAVENETLEPLSTAAKPVEPPRVRGRRSFLFVVAGLAAAAFVAQLVMREPATQTVPTATSTSVDVAAAPSILPTPAPSSTIAETAPSAPSATASAEQGKTSVPKVRLLPPPAASSATPSMPSAAVSATAAVPSATATTKKKRELDRDDPYAH